MAKPSKRYDLTGIDGAQVFRDLPEGLKLRLVNGAIVEIVGNARNGVNLVVNVLENDANPSSVGEEEYVMFTDVQEVIEEGE